jgi:dipeptidyl aminopeptidase/acylaminoacyl peptidase
MNNKIEKEYGSWPSKISANLLAKSGHRFGHLTVDNGLVYWLESLPEEAGRVVLLCGGLGEEAKVITPQNFSVRTRVHEYGGADFSVKDGQVIFANDADQRLYHQVLDNEPRPLTPEPQFKHASRFADIEIAHNNQWLVCVRETHTEDGDPLAVKNEIVRVSISDTTDVEVLVTGSDFYSYPRLSPNGKTITWTSWEHPNMPWDQTSLWTADIDDAGKISNVVSVLSNDDESIYQPAWCPDGELHFVSDRSGWWNIYSFRDQVLNALTPTDAEFGFPQWQFGTSSYAFIDANTLFAAYVEDGREHLCLVEPEKGHITPLDLPYCAYQGGLYYSDEHLYFIASTESEGAAVIAYSLKSKKATILSNQEPPVLTTEDISIAESISFQTTDNRKSYAFFYQPTSSEYQGLENETPPLIVMSHGGPTSATSADFSSAIQYWTTRGFAVVDVNYGGSTGFGREYRNRLKGQWGIVDVDDCVNAAKYLVERGSVDNNRLAIRGGSAGGYTTYTALTNYSLFSAGVSRYGVADLTCLVKESHKFEVRYLDSIIGPWPEAEELYESRSPINHADKISCPVLLLQGDEDAVVPPAQSIAMAEALNEKQIPHALIMLKGEQHGFRKSENICFALESELNFYCQIFNIKPADDLADLILIHNDKI